MRIVSLSTEDEAEFCQCLEDWSDEIKEAGDHKARWLAKMREKGLRVKLALDDKGVAAWGMTLPVFMRASWFRKHGYKKADSVGMQVLLWKPFAADAKPPRWVRDKKTPEPVPGKVAVTALVNGWCPGMNMAFERAKRAAAEFGDKVEFRPVDTFDRAVFREWGEPDAIFVDGKGIRMGPPPTYKTIKKAIAKRVKKLV